MQNATPPCVDIPGLEMPNPPSIAPPIQASGATGKHWQAVEALGRRAACPGNPAKLIDDAAALLTEALDMPLAMSARLAPEADSLRLRLCECSGQSPAVKKDSAEGRSAPGDSLAAYALASGQMIVVDDLARESRFAEPMLQRHGAVSALAVPLRLGEQCFGTLIAADRHPRPFAERERAFAETIGHLVAVTLARWQAEQLLEEERRLACSVLDTLEALVFTLDAEWRIRKANPACQRIAGYEPEQLLDREFWELFAVADEAEMLRQILADIDPGSPPLGSESILRTQAGQRRNIVWSFRKLLLAETETHRVVATGIDVTEQREAEARAERAENAAASVLGHTANGAMPDAGDRSGGEWGPLRSESPFGMLPTPIHIERRGKPRRSYPYTQRIAPIVDDSRPELSAFVEIHCNDIGAGGFSYISDGPPVSDTYVIALGCPPKVTYLTAQIAHVTRVQHAGKRRFLVGCNYIGRMIY